MSTYNTSGLFGTKTPQSDWYGTGHQRDFLDAPDNERFGYTAYGNQLGGSQPFKDWFNTKFHDVYNQYGADTAKNPSLRWTDHLSNNAGNFAQEFSQMGPTRRGEQGLRNLRWLK